MRKFVSMFMALVIAFTMGPVVVARAENGNVEDADELINAIDMVDRCVRHPKICAHGAIAAIKNMLDEVGEPNVARAVEGVLELIKNHNYANFLTEAGKSELAKYPSLKDLAEDNVSFSQVCNVLKTAVVNYYSNTDTKEEL